ncbi:hypothetical protein ACNQ1M_00480 [Mycoplasma sp. VS424B]|uniref:hypothetical protein n=1 Tax=unclassified Mycoplasma TaxID=2683645 RepID=UPI003AACB286
MKLKLTFIPLLGASALLPIVAGQCTQQKDTNNQKSTVSDPQNDTGSGENSNSKVQANPSTEQPNKQNQGSDLPSDSGTTSGPRQNLQQKPGVIQDNKSPQEKIDGQNSEIQTVITNLRNIASESLSMKNIMTTLKNNYSLIIKSIKTKYPVEDDVPYNITEFMDTVKALTSDDYINKFDEETPRYMIPGTHGTTITKKQIISKIQTILINQLNG